MSGRIRGGVTLRPVLFVLLLLWSTSASAATLSATPSNIARLIVEARPGDRIQLTPGAYGKVSIKNVHCRRGLRIDGNGATLTGLMVHRSKCLIFENLELYADPLGEKAPFVVRNSEDIHFEAINVHGSLDGDPQNDVGGLMIRDSARVSVTASEFHQLFVGLSHLNSQDLTFAGNRFHDLQMDGIRGGGSDNVLVSENHFTDFFPKPGDHPDAVQFWGANTTRSASNVTVTGNIILRGRGRAMQGVFIRDGSGQRPFKTVKIANNVILGGMYHGISVDNGNGVEITGNTVAGFPDMKSWIRAERVDGLDLSNNRAQTFLINGENVPRPGRGNTLLLPVRDGGASILRGRRMAPMPSRSSR